MITEKRYESSVKTRHCLARDSLIFGVNPTNAVVANAAVISLSNVTKILIVATDKEAACYLHRRVVKFFYSRERESSMAALQGKEEAGSCHV